MATYCNRCEKDFGMTEEPSLIDEKRYCDSCAGDVLHEKYSEPLGAMIVTTGPGVEGKAIRRYLDIVSSEIVFGTDSFSEIRAGLADMLGRRAKGFEKKLLEAREAAMNNLKLQACALGANAIIAVDLDYGVLTGNKLMVIANGTAVEVG